jgi:hypothetical protein
MTSAGGLSKWATRDLPIEVAFTYSLLSMESVLLLVFLGIEFVGHNFTMYAVSKQ